ncbi:hypothetical protein NKH61_05195 [Mesorhizobium sp. M1005]|uniref:hypothetical protein n=1 Tax=unclassified Mesorhizobium TaxID=325217 RepID=UPI003337F52F
MKKTVVAAALTIFCTSPVRSETGAELLQDNQAFGVGFVWGAVTYMVEDYSLNDDVYNRLTYHRSTCLSKAGVTAKTMYDAVTQEIRADPSLLAKSATVALQSVTYKICGAPPKP